MTRRGEQTREHILTQARQLIQCKGFAATTINDLLKKSGTTKGNLYFHFSDKHAVGLAVLKREQQLFNDFLDWSFDCSDPVEGLKKHFKGVLDKNRREGFVGGCLFGNMALEASDSIPAFSAIVDEVFDEWKKRLEKNIAEAQNKAQIVSNVAAKELAEMIVASIEGGIMQARLKKSETPLRMTLTTLNSLLNVY